MISLALLNIILALFGVHRGFKNKSFIVFIWLIVFYYSITSLISLLDNTSISYSVKMTYALNMSLCILAFLASDFLFNRKVMSTVSFDFFIKRTFWITIVEVVFWISLVMTYVELQTQDYSIYNSREGQAGWAQALFQVSSCIICYFIYKKQWVKIAVAAILVVGMVAATGVRSLVYFILMPFLLYYINQIMSLRSNPFKIIIKSIPIILILIIAVYVVNTLRFGDVNLPETELTTIALNVLDNGGYPLQYANSFLHYITRFLTPIVNAFHVFGIQVVSPVTMLPPSIPHLNDMYLGVAYHSGEAHMPGTIFFDFYMSYGYYGAIWGFVVFSYLKLLCNFLQSSFASFFAFSSVIGWHLYFLMRGSCDTCVSGVSYSMWMAFLLFILLKNRIKKTSV